MPNCLTILYKIGSVSPIQQYMAWKRENTPNLYAAFLRALYESNAQDDFSSFVYDAILYDVNPFSVAAANNTLSPYLISAYERDISLICELFKTNEVCKEFCMGNKLEHEISNAKRFTKEIAAYYKQFGYGDFIRYRSFKFENGALKPITSPSAITVSALKEYADEKLLISTNLENFLQKLPFNNMLLYGQRGTGKSSTIHAMLNKYYEQGLRLVELSKENMLQLGKLKELLRPIPLQFMIYIDDLSLGAGDERISSLKAALEGCSEGNTQNAMIVATSNRRHIVDEKFSEREDSVHSEDSQQEELSLSDRFGLAVLFTTCDKQGYLSIIKQMAKDKCINLSEDELCALAERWAIQKGGRSPRRAKQFCDLVYSLTTRNLPIEF